MTATTLFITNDFGPRAGGIETFVHGLIERLPKGSVIVYTSAQANSTEFDAKWLQDSGVEVIRDRSKILLPTPLKGNMQFFVQAGSMAMVIILFAQFCA